MMTTKPIVKIAAAIMFLVCLMDMPYGYYQLVRFVGMGVFIWLAYLDRSKTKNIFYILWIVLAVLINPFFKISLGRELWNVVDIVLAVVLLVSIWVEKREGNKQVHEVNN